MVIKDMELNAAIAVVGDSHHAQRIRSFLAHWSFITSFTHECSLRHEIKRSLRYIHPSFRTGVE
jgi:hypothetical protein